MTRLNETLFKRMVLGSPSADATPKPSDPARNSASCPALDSHLITMRMQLYPAFTTSMNAQVDSVKRINGSMPAGGLFGGKSSGSDVKDSVVSVVVQRYAELFAAFVQLSDEGDEELMFSRYVPGRGVRGMSASQPLTRPAAASGGYVKRLTSS